MVERSKSVGNYPCISVATLKSKRMSGMEKTKTNSIARSMRVAVDPKEAIATVKEARTRLWKMVRELSLEREREEKVRNCPNATSSSGAGG